MLGRRDYTIHELRTKLLDRGYEPDAVTAVLVDLGDAGLIDDRRVAAAHIRTGSQIKGRGRYRLVRELEARGIDAELAAELVADLTAEEETATIERILARKHLPDRLVAADHRRIFQQLLRRGFPTDAIAAALKKRGLSR